jgi:hypothetical protein
MLSAAWAIRFSPEKTNWHCLAKNNLSEDWQPRRELDG